MKKIIDWIKDILFALLFPWGVILAIAGVVVLCAYIINVGLDGIFGYECVVEETGYYHKTNKPSKCSFIESAERHGYTIKKISESAAMDKGYKICKECFTQKQQETYYELAAFKNRFSDYSKWIEEHKGEELGWDFLWVKAKTDNNADFNNLYVYIDSKSKLHISTYCMELAQDKNARKVRFDDVSEIYTTCEECVGREYVDFIYKKVNEGIYDASLIGEPDDE